MNPTLPPAATGGGRNAFARPATLCLLAAVCLAALAPCLAQDPQADRPVATAPAGVAAPRKITIGESAILGVIEGVTEYLPVSSTGHLIIAAHAMGLEGTESIEAFEIVIQLGAILAVVGLYRARVRQMLRGLAGRDRDGLHLFVLLVLAFLPAAVVGLLLRKPIKENLFSPATVAGALLVGGVLMILVEKYWYARREEATRKRDVTLLGYRHALLIGVFQCLAMWPGTSRSMITILAGLLVGLDMVRAAEFSFLLGLPTLGAATIYEGVKDFGPLMESAGASGLLVGVAVSGVVAAVAVKGFVRWLTGHGMVPFGLYRMLLAVAVWAYFYWA
jgi:undecaprenyl-diphosphatase